MESVNPGPGGQRMVRRTKLIAVELSHSPDSVEGLGGYTTLKALVRLHGTPIGYVEMPVVGGCCTAATIRRTILEQLRWPIIHHLLSDLLAASTGSMEWRIPDLLQASHPVCSEPLPMVTVAVCTRDRPVQLALCLATIDNLDYPSLDILVVDNAPSNDETERLVRAEYPDARYVREPRPGLNWARNRAIAEARGEILAYTDDDVVVDSEWVRALATTFAEHPEVMAVTGLVIPYELETEAQVLFERYGGFGRGFKREWYRLDPEDRERWRYYGTGRFGTGANMAYRRSLFDQIGPFDPALDVGTVTNGGGDLEMFFRVLKEGHTLVYEPAAIVRHRHRRDYAQLRTQIRNNGIGLYSYIVRSALAYPEERPAFTRLGLYWLWWWNIRRAMISILHPARFPRDLILAELRGSFIGMVRYPKARSAAAEIAGSFPDSPPAMRHRTADRSRQPDLGREETIAVRTVDLSQPLSALTDVTGYTGVRIFVTRNDCPLGHVNITNQYQPIGVSRLRQAIANHLGLTLLQPGSNTSTDSLWADMLAALTRHYMPAGEQTEDATTRLRSDVSVSIVLATHDRIDDLRECLRCLVAQESPRQIEIIVVDNNPASGLTPPVVAEFPGVTLVSEPRKGLSYARNAGIAVSRGEIVVATDDDVTMPPTWLEKLIAPFVRPDVMVVTGNVLPLELTTPAQRLFEKYGGLGRGFKPREVGGDWFESSRRHAVPTWELGATANAAFRASIFGHPQIGLMDEALGVGTPTGCSEDTYLFYRVLKAGHTILYQPAAYVWHKHRRDMRALRRQIYGYSKGHVAYHLTTLLRDHDLRALMRLSIHLPRWHIKQVLRQIKSRLRGKRMDYPLSLTLLEIAGNLAGPWALWRSRRRVKREGRSQPYVPVLQRSTRAQEPLPVEAHHQFVAMHQQETSSISSS
jgi:GT2 family glycosyltransferase